MAWGPVTTFGSLAGCGHVVVRGSFTVLTGGFFPVARWFDKLNAPSIIIGPGNVRVWVNSIPVSRVLDLTTPHPDHPIFSPIVSTFSPRVWV